MHTKLLYLEDMSTLTCSAQVAAVLVEDGKTVVVVDQTVFYPQGGGQPYDTGTITSVNKTFTVEEVRYMEGVVRHIGVFAGEPFVQGDKVTCQVNAARRQLHSRLHSAGHVVDMGLKRLGIVWMPGKGYHFPNGPYDEYVGSLEGVDVEKLKVNLEAACNATVAEGVATKVLFMPQEEMGSVCAFVPAHLPKGKPGRVVMYGDFGIPCGGTHVANLGDIGHMTIRKIKQEGPNIRVAYAVE